MQYHDVGESVDPVLINLPADQMLVRVLFGPM